MFPSLFAVVSPNKDMGLDYTATPCDEASRALASRLLSLPDSPGSSNATVVPRLDHMGPMFVLGHAAILRDRINARAARTARDYHQNQFRVMEMARDALRLASARMLSVKNTVTARTASIPGTTPTPLGVTPTPSETPPPAPPSARSTAPPSARSTAPPLSTLELLQLMPITTVYGVSASDFQTTATRSVFQPPHRSVMQRGGNVRQLQELMVARGRIEFPPA